MMIIGVLPTRTDANIQALNCECAIMTLTIACVSMGTLPIGTTKAVTALILIPQMEKRQQKKLRPILATKGSSWMEVDIVLRHGATTLSHPRG